MEHTIAQTTPAPAPMADAQCERDALGAALTYNQLLDSLSPELFRDPSCSAIFTAARAVRSAGGEADVVGVMAWSAAHQAGISPEALTSLFDRPNPASPFARNLARLRELAARRRMAAVASLARAAATSEVVGLRQAVEAVAVHAAVSGRTAKRKVTEARAMGILAVDRHTEKYSLKGG